MQRVRRWVAEVSMVTRPEEVVWCDGSEEEYQRLRRRMQADGTLQAMNPEQYPNCTCIEPTPTMSRGPST
jgi:phosphoenolpyruvate carboxykinase (GTP)